MPLVLSSLKFVIEFNSQLKRLMNIITDGVRISGLSNTPPGNVTTPPNGAAGQPPFSMKRSYSEV